MKFKSFADLIEQVKGKSNRVVVPGANNKEALTAIKMADQNGLISHGILIGPLPAVKQTVAEVGLDDSKFEFIDCEDVPTMCKLAVDQILAGKGDFLIKGLVDTKYYMKAILNKEAHLVPEGALLSHFVLFSTPKYHKPFAVTDSAVVIAPTLEQKAKIIQNAVNTMHKLGLETPKVSCVCPVEKVNEKIPSTVDAAEKGIKGKVVAGDADILMLPDLDAANPLYKALAFFGDHMEAAAVLVGPKIPVILPSRADDPKVKLNAIALCSFLKDQK